MEWRTIGSPGNRPDRFEFGCVPYEYEMAKYQLSNADWCDFLNAVGYEASMRLKLYHKDMTSGILGGIDVTTITPHSSPLTHNFSSKPGWEKKPIVYINYTSVCRYCNWLTSGDTERGSYDMSRDVPARLPGAKYFIPSDDEWYKAAYWRDGNYANYPTGNELPRLDQANFERGDAFSKGPPFYLADVDEYAEASTPAGVVQMGGNAWEMLETVSRDTHGAWQNHYRGGSFGYTETGMSKLNRDSAPYNGRCYVFGVRIACKKEGWFPMRMPLRFGILLAVKKGARACRRRLSLR